ncbi:hypothetical protein P153DRAFT_388129 [Dothidotthia symphoricarpi CBS 119687]|uniref:Uncharacterized protein n=1 Tax=Dothidotthia symphoricarpi CBS 119687 TaxID=1392245 RepID=A0A6A6A7L5_9PLEO|nr:uncharacterized protein P153DRAFT_388129 [Dothidotthia symphoricarpi CBS 119687]KAF2126807.1 hypothetical protein P153DRAFT_388129 [Dothidotthia symphoricarpi CBS 119687]
MDDNFNSSDIEVDAAPPDRLALAGTRSVDIIFANTSAFRIESKKAVEQLQSVNGAPTMRMQRARWAKCIEHFLQRSSQQDTTPDLGDHLRKTHFLKGKELSTIITATKAVTGTD